MEFRVYEICIGDYFEDNVDAIRAAINSAIDYAFANYYDQVHVLTNNPRIIIDQLPEFKVKSCTQLAYGNIKWMLVIPLVSAERLKEKVKDPSVLELETKDSKNESELLILSYIREKVEKAISKGWTDVFIKHRIPNSVISILESEKNYKFTVSDNGTMILWGGKNDYSN